MNNPNKNFKIILGIILVIILGVLVYFIAHQQRFSATLNIEIAPQSAKITLNGKSVQPGTTKVQPGSQNVAVTMTGFATSTKKVTVKKGGTTYVGIALSSNTPETADWYQNHPEDQQQLQIISGKNFDNISKQAAQNLPLIKKLPYIGAGFEFKIGYGVPPNSSDPSQQAIYILYPNDQAKQDALTWIKNQGYDPAKLNIVYQTADSSSF